MPMASIAEEERQFSPTFFDINANGLDDRIEPLIKEQESVNVILMFTEKPTLQHYEEINNIGIDITHIYKYINAIRLDEVPSEKIVKLTEITDLKLVKCFMFIVNSSI